MNFRFYHISFLFLALFMGYSSSIRSQVVDDFSDGNLSVNPEWFGDRNKFWINNQFQLQLNDSNATSSNKSYLSTASEAMDSAIWELYFDFSFSPSTSNYARFYLVSDHQNLKGPLNGYYVKIGGASGNVDDVSLYRQQGTKSVAIIRGVPGTVASLPIGSIKVTRIQGLWELHLDTTSSSNWVSQGSVVDTNYLRSLYCGILCSYSSTRKFAFAFDDLAVKGKAIPDTTPPRLIEVNWKDNSLLNLHFSEAMDSLEFANARYWISDELSVDSVIIPSLFNREIQLRLNQEPKRGKLYQFSVGFLSDYSGNPIQPDTFEIGVPDRPKVLEVVFTELMPIPSSEYGLDEFEYLEIQNTGSRFLHLDSCLLSDKSSSTQLKDVYLKPKEIVLLCQYKALSSFEKNAVAFGVSNWPSLNNTDDSIAITCPQNALIHHINYREQDANFSPGRSMEIPRLEMACLGHRVWLECKNSNGGTPGKVNSVWSPNAQAPNQYVASVFAAYDTLIEVQFGYDISFTNWKTAAFQIQEEAISKELNKVSDNAIHLIPNHPLPQKAKLQFESPDLDGCFTPEQLTRDFYLTEVAIPGDLLFNEILFEPFPSANSEFIELVNSSDKVVNLQGWQICEFDEENQQTGSCFEINTSPKLIHPDSLIVVLTDAEDILAHYSHTRSSTFLELKSWLSLPNSSGSLILRDSSKLIVDHLRYSKEDHHILLNDTRGVSLERNSYVTNAAWFSTSSSVGFASPGLTNSQFISSQKPNDFFEVYPEVFSPDNDGFNDFLTLSYKLDRSGYVGTISVYDVDGRFIKSICDHDILGTSGEYFWDGRRDNNTGGASIGIYIIYAEFHHPTRKSLNVKKTCVLGVKL